MMTSTVQNNDALQLRAGGPALKVTAPNRSASSMWSIDSAPTVAATNKRQVLFRGSCEEKSRGVWRSLA